MVKMKEFLEREGAYSYIVIALLAFFLGIFSALIVEAIKRKLEKDRLIDLFITDIYRNWKNIEQLGHSPIDPYFSRMVYIFKDVNDLKFTGHPEYEFEVHNIKFYETEGFKLVQQLSRKARKEFWDIYSLLRDAEAARQVLRTLAAGHKDRSSYQLLFKSLVEILAKKMNQFEQTLDDERSLYSQLSVRLISRS